jgi:predicted GNAT superfamily acetyltransferase
MSSLYLFALIDIESSKFQPTNSNGFIKMNIKKASEKDLPYVLELNTASIPHVSKVNLDDMRTFLKYADPFLIIEEEGKIAGFMIVLQKGLDYKSLNYKFFCDNYSDFDYVDRIVISKEFRGKKFGTSLYNYLFQNSNQKMITCEINIKPPNINSMEFHKALGFNQVAEQVTEGGNKSVAMMIKIL